MTNFHKIKLLFLLLLTVLGLLFNVKTSSAASCGPDVTTTCYYWESYCRYEDWNDVTNKKECILWGCRHRTSGASESTITFPCDNAYPQVPGQCVTRAQYSVCYFPNGDTSQKPSIVQCGSGSTDTWATCGGGTTPPGCSSTNYGQGSSCTNLGGTCQNSSLDNSGNTCTPCDGTYQTGLCPGPSNWKCCVPNTPTPTPATVCKPLGDPCSGGGGNCCSKVCS